MKKVILFLFLVSLNFLVAQEVSPKKTIEEFFVAFHKKDTVKLREISHKWIIMQTIGKDKEGINMIVPERFDDFIESISAIPKTMKFEERILDFQIQYDESLAHVWTPYEFYINDTLSHKGVNSFTLIKENGVWKIVHLIDTRTK